MGATYLGKICQQPSTSSREVVTTQEYPWRALDNANEAGILHAGRGTSRCIQAEDIQPKQDLVLCLEVNSVRMQINKDSTAVKP